MNIQEKLTNLKNILNQDLNTCISVRDLENIKIKLLSKKGSINALLEEMKKLGLEDKKKFGKEINDFKNLVTSEIQTKQDSFSAKALGEKIAKEFVDVTIPVRKTNQGTIHPLSKVRRELEEIFESMGFVIAEGPEIEDDWHCFEALNTPPHHPARQMQDTFYLPDSDDGKKMVLRTQTSSVQIREMKDNKPPFKFITLGKTFRCDSDATHTPMFHQIEGVYIDKNVTMAHLKSCLVEFCKKFFEVDQVPIIIRPSYFPFVEPAIEIDVKCQKSKSGIKIGEQYDDVMEILGAGMVHPNVLRNVGLDPEEYQGFAFGTGIERLTMLKYGIGDMRMLFEGDIRFLKHYGFKFFQ